jgi:murein DD-endopeptidase MepM/ murein hydrolase activator NlpD
MPRVDRAGFIWPVQGPVISRFGRRGLWGWHRGLDIKAPRGAPIRAAAAGTVVFSGRQSSYGRVIKIAHANGLSTIYAHNSANFVKAGDRVTAGALIGAVGRTGHATTSHLHFEIRRGGAANDPLPLLRHPDPRPTLATHQSDQSDASPKSPGRHDRIGRSKN